MSQILENIRELEMDKKAKDMMGPFAELFGVQREPSPVKPKPVIDMSKVSESRIPF